MDNIFGLLAVALTADGRPSASGQSGIDTAIDVMHDFNAGKIPDKPGVRDALEMWGIEVIGADHPMVNFVGARQGTVSCKLPDGWVVKNVGNGHNGLFDDFGRERIHWHVHPWDGTSLSFIRRFNIYTSDRSKTAQVIEVRDGGQFIVQSFPVRLPVSREQVCIYESGHKSYFFEDDQFENDGQLGEAYRANEAATQEGRQKAKQWLDENHPEWDQYGPKAAATWLEDTDS